MFLYIIFLICVFYEDITGVINHIKHGPDVRDVLEIGGNGNDFTFAFKGHLTEFIYTVGLLYGTIRGPYHLVFVFVLFLAQIPKKQLWWTIVDSILSIVLLTGAFILIFYQEIFEIIDLFQ